MYSKEEATRIKQQFWINFGRYMKPIPSADGLPVNWVNYKTGVKQVYFRMNAERDHARISIDITHQDPSLRKHYFEQFESFKTLLHQALGEEWTWESTTLNNFGIELSQISTTLTDFNVYNQQHWPALISFLKPRIIALDEFWVDVKPVFEGL